MAQLTLIKAVFGIGNPNHDHVFRHNTFNVSSTDIDRLQLERFNGGVMSGTLGEIANNSGGLSVQPQGYVNIEEGFNTRRGIGMLKFQLDSGAIQTVEICVVGYLHGGGFSTDGIDSETMFVPVRSWEAVMRTTNGAFNSGYPTVERKIQSSDQLLLGDAHFSKDLKAVRPSDLGNAAVGGLAVEEDWDDAVYMGTLGQDLKSSPQLSKTENLDPSFYARQALRLATHGDTLQVSDLPNTLCSGLEMAGMKENSISSNPFFSAMSTHLGNWNMSGFNGWSVGEINSVFSNFADVLNLELLNESSFAVVDNTMDSHAYGTSSMFETLASEIAMITINLLMKSGLTSLTFSATNNPEYSGGMVGSDDGIAIIVGEAMSALDNDEYIINRVEQFKTFLKSSFFGKYSGGSSYNSTLINVEVSSYLFGETSVSISLNGDTSDTRKFVNATYAISRTSTNIASSEVALAETNNFMHNLKNYFVTE